MWQSQRELQIRELLLRECESRSVSYILLVLLKILHLLFSLACLQIPDEHLNGCAVYPHPEHPVPTVLRPEGAGVPDTDFLLYVFTHSTDKCRAEVDTMTLLRLMQVVIKCLVTFLHACLSLVYWLTLLTVRQIQRGVLWLGLWSSVESRSVWKYTHMSAMCR